MPLLLPDLVRHSEIKKRLRDVHSSLSAVSAELGCSSATVTIVSQGYRKSHSVQEAIAKKLGLQPEELFPERYERTEDNT